MQLETDKYLFAFLPQIYNVLLFELSFLILSISCLKVTYLNGIKWVSIA